MYPMKQYTVIADAKAPNGTVKTVVINAIPAHSEDDALIHASHRIRETGAMPVALRKVRRTDIEPKLTVHQVQRMTGASWSALAAQYAATAQSMCEIAAKARATGKKFRGYTADHAQAEADDFTARAAECSAQVP